MLDDVKNAYQELANNLEDWKHMSKNEIAEIYLSTDDEIKKNWCVGALVSKCWTTINNNYYRQYDKQVDIEEYYSWLVDSIMRVLNEQSWKNPNSSIYNDPNGVEKAINTVFKCTKINYFVAQKRFKRIVNCNSLSLDSLEEDASDGFFVPFEDEYSLEDNCITSMIKKLFAKKYYFQAIMLDIISFNDITNNDDKYYQKLFVFYTKLPDAYFDHFCEKYDISKNDMYNARTHLQYNRKYFDRNLNTLFRELKYNKEFMDNLRI